MEKEFVPYELAVKLKALGFDEPCFGRWWFRADMHKLKEEELEIIRSSYFELSEHCILAPTFSQAFRWFREKYGYWSYVKEAAKGTCRFYIEKFDEKFFNSHGVDTYEKAELACLTKLIEIVETRNF